MLSGVLRGTIPVLILFLICVNEISSNISNTNKLVSADDTKIWKELENVEKEKQEPQFDIDELAAWTKKWNLHFNFDKLEVLASSAQTEQILANLHVDFKSYNL